jgi:hypothetical protein
VNFDDNQGFSDVSNWPVTFGTASAIARRSSARGSSSTASTATSAAVSRVDSPGGGVVPTNPLMNDTWSGNQLGDFWVGGKLNLMSEWQQKPAAVAGAV